MKWNYRINSGAVRHQLKSVLSEANCWFKCRKTFVLSSLSVVILSGCTDFLTEDLKGQFTSETFYQNDQQALQAINGAYQAITFTSSNNDIWVFGDVASDDAVKGGNPGDQAEITFIDEFNANSNNGIISNYWSFAYEAITRANNVIAYVPAVTMILFTRTYAGAKVTVVVNFGKKTNIEIPSNAKILLGSNELESNGFLIYRQ